MEKQLVERLRDAGSRLELFPSQVDQLLPLLDEVENLLEKVDQSPSGQIQNAYSKITKALLAEPLMRHRDADVQVSVASCISEITRITAPEAPYDDDQMKEIFQLIVLSFAGLSDMSSRSYDKRASILETVAKIRSCVVMLDLECDELIIEMFKHFLRSIRDDHPNNIFESMETIMTVVLEESEDVSVDLLMPILAILKRGDEENPSVARKLGECVFTKCAVKLRPFLKQAVKSSGLSLDDYSKIVTTICRGSKVAHNEGDVLLEQLAEKSKATASTDGMTQDAKELVPEQAFREEVPKKPDENDLGTKPINANVNKVDNDDLDTENLGKVDAKQERTAKKGGIKTCSTKPSEALVFDGDKETEIICQKASDKEADRSPGLGKDAHITLDEDPQASPDKEELPLSQPELLDSEVNASVSPSKSLSDESSSKKFGVSTEKDTLAQELASVDSALEKANDGTSGAIVKPETHSEKKKLNLAQEDAHSMDSAPEEAADINSDSEIKSEKRSGIEENFGQDHHSANNLCAGIVADADGGNDSDNKVQELSRKNEEDSGQEDEPPEDLISPSSGSNDSGKLSGKEKVNLTQENVEPVLQKVDDEISDFKDISQRRSGKKVLRTKKATSCVMKGNMVKGRGTSKTDTEDNNDEEEEIPQSAEGDESDSEPKPLVQSGKEVTGRRRGRPLKKSGKVDMLKTKRSNKKHETTKGNVSDTQTDVDESDSDTKPLMQSGKEKTSKPMGQSLKKSGKGYASEGKLPGKKEDKTNKDEVSLKKDDSRTVLVKNKKEKFLSKSQTKDENQGVTSPKSTPQSTPKPFIDNDPKENSKRKRTPGEDKVSGDIEYGANLVGARVKVWWPDDRKYYEGIIESFDFRKKKHKVSYTDGDEEVLLLQKEKWEFLEDGTMQDERKKDANPSSSARLRKRNPEQSSKQKQMEPESPKPLAKDKTPRRGNTSSGTGKVKSSSSKLEENSLKGKSSGKTPQSAKLKSADTSKAEKSGERSGRKRRRGF